MSIALSEFWTRLVRGGIADAADCKRLANAYADARGAPASDVELLAEFLIQTGELTEFQSQCLLSPTAVALRFGDFVRQTDAVSVPLSHWLSVRAVQDGSEGFLIRVGPNQLTQNRRQWLQAHAAVDAPALQPIQLHENPSSGILDVFSKLPPGQCLNEITSEKMKVGRRQALNVAINVADALAVMHTRSLVHGAVRADRVWITSEGNAILLRDPSGPPLTPRQDQSAAWVDVMESPGAYAAPEFADPGFACNPRTDIYSLGCLLFRMIVGRLPFSGVDINAEIAANVNEVPLELSEAIGQGEAGDPVLRVIAYVMAKSPAARFATAHQVSEALTAVLGIIDDAEASESKIQASAADVKAAATETPPTTQEAAPPAPPVQAPPLMESARESKTSRRESRRESRPAAGAPPPRKDTRSKQAPAETWQDKSAKTQRRGRSDKKERPAKPESPSVPAGEKATKRAKSSAPAKPPVQQVDALASQQRSEAKPTPKPPSPPAAPPQPSGQPAAVSGESPTPAPPAPTSKTPPPVATHPSESAERFSAVASEAAGSGSDDRPTRRRRRKKKNNLPFVFGILSVPVLLMVIFLIAQGTGGGGDTGNDQPVIAPQRVPTVGQARRVTQVPDKPAPQQPQAPSGYQLVDDDRLLWVPPYGAGSSKAPLDLLPPGPAVIITTRLSKVMADPIGSEMIQALSPELAALIKTAADRAQVPQESIERCTVALHAGKDGWPATSLAIELAEPVPLTTLADRWQASVSRTRDGATIYSGDEPDGDVYYLGDSENGKLANDASVKRFAVGPLEQIREVAANEGGVIPLPRSLDKVWGESSVESDLVAMITPNFLFADGREMIQSSAPELVVPLKSVLIPDVAAVLISATTGGNDLYAEMRAVPSGGISEAILMRKISDSFASLPAWADGFVVDSVPDASWRLLATRMPLMLRFMTDHTRFGVSDGTIVANTYLPGTAATQITLATLLAMNTKPGGASTAVAASPPSKPLTIEEMLNRKMSVDFGQESLEFGINVIIDQFASDLPSGSTAPTVRIIGGDLEKSGITQNQQIRDFSKQDLPLRTVLTDLLLGANPDKTATGPRDPKQSLVWVVVPNESAPGGKEILISTRAASEGVYELPDEFKPEK